MNNQLTIDGREYGRKELIRVSERMVNNHNTSDWQRELYRFILLWMSDAETIDIKTSGSTGSPKILKAHKSSMAESALRTGRYLGLREHDTALLVMPAHFIAGQMMVVRAFVLGLNLIPFKPAAMPLDRLRSDIDFAAMTPMQVQAILDSENGTEKIKLIRKLIIGGGSISPELEAHLAVMNNQIWSTYGMTETLTHVAMKKMNGPDKSDTYSALQGISFEKDHRDCLIIKGAGPGRQKIITNDIIKLYSDHSFEFLGRIDNIINSGGVKISPERVEQLLAPFLGSKRFVVTGIPDRLTGEKLVLVIEGEPDKNLNLDQIAITSCLDKFETPKDIAFVMQFPETENGKIVREKVREMVKSD